MNCPYCLAWHEKKYGCSTVFCENCNLPFDFQTGGPWSESSVQRIVMDYGLEYYRSYIASESVLKRIKKDENVIYVRRSILRNK